jgi:AbiTii-like protein
LRQCILLGYELKNESLKTWANQELNGYRDPEAIPKYRIVSAGAIGIFRSGLAYPAETRHIPALMMEETHRDSAEIVRLAEPISAYENHLKSDGHNLTYLWDSNLIAYYQTTFIRGYALVTASQQVSLGAIVGALDTIRTLVLNMALEIREEIGESDADFKKVKANPVEAAKVNHIVINQIYGGTVFMGGSGTQTINVQNIAVGNWQDLTNPLQAIGIPEAEVGELSSAILKDGKTMGQRVQSWIGRNAAKVFDHGLRVGTTVGTTILTEYIKRHFGLA